MPQNKIVMLQMKAVQLIRDADIIVYDDLGTQVCEVIPPLLRIHRTVT